LIDGDHSAEGVRQTFRNLLEILCKALAVILLHDTMTRRTRAGTERVEL